MSVHGLPPFQGDPADDTARSSRRSSEHQGGNWNGPYVVVFVVALAIVGFIGLLQSDGTAEQKREQEPSGDSYYSQCVAAGERLDRQLAEDGYDIVDAAQHARAMQEIRDRCRKG